MEWTPPSEAEMKVIQAKRERADKISNLMGSYLLKGYKMLNETCPKCTTIYLRDKQDELYCVACVEVDTDTEKDNPASSAEAARRQVAESQFSSSPGAVRRRPTASILTAAASPAGDQRTSPTRAVTSNAAGFASTAASSFSINAAAAPFSVTVAAAPSSAPAEDERALAAAAAAVRGKLAWAAGQLEAATSVESSAQLVGLIRTCADALQALRRPETVPEGPVV